MKRAHSFSAITTEATRLLGSRIALARRERRWSVQELAERVGVTRVTIHRIEQGDPRVGLGIAFEAAAVLGVPLFDEDPSRRRLEAARTADRLAVLPARVRKPLKVSDDF
jgi:transcriptional regulator with XRE-family HTH domain